MPKKPPPMAERVKRVADGYNAELGRARRVAGTVTRKNNEGKETKWWPEAYRYNRFTGTRTSKVAHDVRQSTAYNRLTGVKNPRATSIANVAKRALEIGKFKK